MQNHLSFIMIFILVGIVVLLICRELVCWYYKINKAVDVMNTMNENVVEIYNVLVQLRKQNELLIKIIEKNQSEESDTTTKE